MSFELNPDQKRAAECLDRPVLVTAGAGSGKTRMLTQRFVNAVMPGAVSGWERASVDEVLAITFTDKAAGEIGERVRLALLAAGLGEDARRAGAAWISTIHGMCSRILRRHPFEAGVDPFFAVADTVTTGELRAEAFESAADRLLAESSDAERLFERYGFPALFSATTAIARELAIAGLGPDALRIESAEPAEGLLARANELLAEGSTSCHLDTPSKSEKPKVHAALCVELLGRCSGLVDAGSEEELLSELLAVLGEYKRLPALKGIEDFGPALEAEIEALKGRVAASLTAPYAALLKRLVGEYVSGYSARKAERELLDFDDLQLKAVELLTRNPDIAERYRRRFRAVMIDEFQDTDALQLRLMEAISDRDLCTVGDEKQSIYRFRGADIEVYRQHQAEMRAAGALVAELAVNYRSHGDVLAFVNGIFGSDEYFGGGLLRLELPDEGRRTTRFDALLGGVPRAEVVFVDSAAVDSSCARAAEAKAVAQRLAELRDAGASAKDMAILVRTYSYAHVYAAALADAGFTATVVGGSRFFQLGEVAIMRALTKALANPDDDQALGLLMATDFAPLSSDALASIAERGHARPRPSLWARLQATASDLAVADREVAERLIELVVEGVDGLARRPLAHVLLTAVERAGWDLRLLSAGNVGRDGFANVMKFARQAAEFEASQGGGAAAFAQHLDLKEALGDKEAPATLADDDSDAVRIMSVHASKGLEFPIVVVPELGSRGGSDQTSVRVSRQDGGVAVALKTPPPDDPDLKLANSTWFEQFKRIDAVAEAEEDARVLYVAFTRAEELLIASGSFGMQSKSGTSSQADIAKLSRVLGVRIPVDGPMDVAAAVPGAAAPCRVRVIQPQPAGDALGADADGGATAEACADNEASLVQAHGSGLPVLPPASGPLLERFERSPIPTRVSYTQLSEFEHCPKRFWARRVLGVRGDASEGVAGAGARQFGTALHAALRLVDATGAPPSAERLAAISRYFELEPGDRERLAEAVSGYCSSEAARRVLSAGAVRREASFAIEFDARFFLTGALDLYARTGDAAYIVDYKSGSSDAEDLADRYRLQAECYALAVFRDGFEQAEIEFVRPEVRDDDGALEHVSFEFTRVRDAERIERELVDRYAAIECSAFEPLPGAQCRACDVRAGLCSYVGKTLR